MPNGCHGGVLAVAGVAVLASLVDVVTTWIALSGGARELNPITSTVMDAAGIAGTLLAGLVLRLTIVGVLAALSRARGPRTAQLGATVVLVAAACWWVLVDVSNVSRVA